MALPGASVTCRIDDELGQPQVIGSPRTTGNPVVFVKIIAGGSGSTSFFDGRGVSAYFGSIVGACLDAKGNLVVADEKNHRVRLAKPVAAAGANAGAAVQWDVTTLAGSGKRGFAEGN